MILNYTTQIKADKTVSEIQQILARGKVRQISVDYDGGQPSAIQFSIVLRDRPIFFRLPCNVAGVYKSLSRSRAPARFKTTEQARRVAWRIIKDWVEAQIAIVEAEQAELIEVFLPYAVGANGETVYQAFVNNQKLLNE